ncbi:MAG: transmembrane 220 family protein [Saonia sp.]
MQTFFKTLSIVFALLFIWAAYVQYNDPDALQWYMIYGLAALASILVFMKKLNFITALVLFIGYIIGAFMMWPQKFEGVTIGEGDIVNIERGREALGLLIVAGVMLMYAFWIRYTKKSKS